MNSTWYSEIGEPIKSREKHYSLVLYILNLYTRLVEYLFVLLHQVLILTKHGPLGVVVFQVKNYYVAAGMNSSGIAKAAGVGRALSEWMTAGEPPVDLSPFDIRRFSRDHNNKMFLRDRVKETLGEHYAMRFPYSERKTARNVKCSALHCRLDAAGAVWGEKNGWERANWFQVPGEGTSSRYVVFIKWTFFFQGISGYSEKTTITLSLPS